VFLELNSISFGNRVGRLILERSDIRTITSLSRLQSLKIYRCDMSDDAFSALVRIKGLSTIRIAHLVDPAVLVAIGRSLVSLELWRPSKEVVDGIVESCPNLQCLDLRYVKCVDDEEKEVFVGSIKSGLKKLAKFFEVYKFGYRMGGISILF
jgi:hypothetical protein